jgi:hypothetical protein
MKTILKSIVMGAALIMSAQIFAQTSTPNPFEKPGASAPTPATTSKTVNTQPVAPAPSTTSAKTSKPASMPATQAAGGGDGKVWVNTASKTYHCPGTKYYGKTKAGEYMTEAEAKAGGNHPNHKKACS